MIDTEHILVFFTSPTGLNWQPVERENIPDWLRDADIIKRLIGGERAINYADKAPKYYCAIQVERPRLIGYREQMRKARAAANTNDSGVQIIA